MRERETKVTIPELALIAGTRAAAGAGIGLLLADRLSAEQRKAVGWTLLCVGILSTIPIAFEVLGGRRLSTASAWPEQAMGGAPSDADDRFLSARTSSLRT